MADIAAHLFVHQAVFALSWYDMDLLFTDHIMEPVRIDPRRIYDHTGFKNPPAGGQAVASLQLLYLLHLCVQAEFHPVHRCVLRQRYGQPKGTYDAAPGCIQRRCHVLRHVGLQPAHLLSLQNLEPFHSVRLPLIIKPPQDGPVLLIEAEHQRPVSLIRKIQLTGQRLHEPAAHHVQGSLPGARRSVEARMDDAAVGLGGAFAHIAGPLQDLHLPVPSGQLPCDGASRHAPADHDDICHMYLPARIPFLLHQPILFQRPDPLRPVTKGPPVFCLIISSAYPKSKRIGSYGKIGQKKKIRISKKDK